MGARGNVLVVEDDLDTGQVVAAILTSAGFGVRHVTNRDAALFAVSLYLYDFILLDLSMPGITIDEFMQRSSEFRSAEVVMISAFPVVDAEARRLGIRHVLKKPFGVDELLDLLSRIAPNKVSGRKIEGTRASGFRRAIGHSDQKFSTGK